MAEKFRVGISADFESLGRDLVEPVANKYFGPLPHAEYEFMQDYKAEVTPDQLQPYDAVISLAVQYTPKSFRGVDRFTVLARWGVGYDMVDVQACTDNDVLLCITPEGVRRPVAEGIVSFLLALTRHLLINDRLVREGRWEEKTGYPGIGLSGRTLGSVGVGNIGAEVFRLLQPFDLSRLLAYDPYVSPEAVAPLGVDVVDLDTLLAESDFVCINCPLNDETFHMIGEAELERMKPTAFLINTARGPIVDYDALTRALQDGRIAGAALDVFEEEPLPADHPLSELDNVILSPHGIAWTDQLVRLNGAGACENILTAFRGEVPEDTVNRDVVERPGFQAKLQSFRERWNALAE